MPANEQEARTNAIQKGGESTRALYAALDDQKRRTHRAILIYNLGLLLITALVIVAILVFTNH